MPKKLFCNFLYKFRKMVFAQKKDASVSRILLGRIVLLRNARIIAIIMANVIIQMENVLALKVFLEIIVHKKFA
jgi:hypothetical protein